MAIKTLPAGIVINRQTFGQKRFDMTFQNGDSGASQSRVLAPPRWVTSINCHPDLTAEESATWRAMMLGLKGRINQLAIGDLLNPAPRGTLRGTLTLSAAAAAGAGTLTITGGAGQAGNTLLLGDYISVGAGATVQLVTVGAAATANASGVIVVEIDQPMRFAQASAAAVTWDKPVALFRQTGDSSGWESGIFQGNYSLDLMESWE